MEMNKFKKRVMAFFLTVCCIVGMIQSPTEAAAKPVMESINMKWDLKNNKQITYKTTYYQMDKNGKKLKNLAKNNKLKLTDYKVTKLENGKKKLTFKAVFSFSPNFSKTEVDRICRYQEYESTEIGAYMYATLVDYKTGECLESKNSKGVEVFFGDWVNEGYKCYYGNQKTDYYEIFTKSSIVVEVIYPENYKDLCIIAGGCSEPLGKCTKLKGKSINDLFNGTINFKKADGVYSKKDSAFCHGLRVK